MVFLDSARAGLLENVQNHFSSPLGSWEIAKNEVHTFFWNTLYLESYPAIRHAYIHNNNKVSSLLMLILLKVTITFSTLLVCLVPTKSSYNIMNARAVSDTSGTALQCVLSFMRRKILSFKQTSQKFYIFSIFSKFTMLP